jgi:hypothetical protein
MFLERGSFSAFFLSKFPYEIHKKMKRLSEIIEDNRENKEF